MHISLILHNAMGYLEEILTGNYSNFKEDRLSQVFSATFNHSNLFKKIFLKTIGYPYPNVKNLYSQTQRFYVSNKRDARIDILIINQNRPIILIENKVDSPLKLNQLKVYNNILELKNCKKIALVKHYFESIASNYNWRIFHWSELYASLSNELEKGVKDIKEHFLISNFIEHLESMDMSVVNRISKKNLENLALVLNKLKTDAKIHTSLSNKNFFETGNQIVSILEAIVLRARTEKLIIQRVGNSIKASPHFSWWYDDDSNDLRLTINVTIKVSNSKNKINAIGTGLYFYNKNPKKYAILSFAQYKLGGDYEEELEYKGKDLILDSYAKQVITVWKKWLK